MATTRQVLFRSSNACLRANTTPRPVALPRTTAASHRYYSSPTTPVQLTTSPFAPRHLLSIADLTPTEFTTLVRNAAYFKTEVKSGHVPAALKNTLLGKTIAMTFSKRSTRTRVSTEGAVAMLGGHPMFLGSNDIQLGVNESLYDTSVVISSMVDGIFARVNKHEEVATLAKHSSVPVINALCDLAHPLQTIADFLTLHETFPASSSAKESSTSLGLEGIKLAWIGDSNNVLFDLAIGCAKQNVTLAVASPTNYGIPSEFRSLIKSSVPSDSAATFALSETTVPAEAIQSADVLVTDTWISMGQESDSAQRLKDFAGYQITSQLAQESNAKPDWKFMHCLPRHQEEVSDEVFYDQKRSLVWREAENRLWAAVAVLEGFMVKKGKITDARDSA